MKLPELLIVLLLVAAVALVALTASGVPLGGGMGSGGATEDPPWLPQDQRPALSRSPGAATELHPVNAQPGPVAQQEPPVRSSLVPPAHVPGKMLLGVGAPLGGARPFADGDPWNMLIENEPVDPASDQLIASIGGDRPLHPDFGAGTWDGAPIGIPYVIVGPQQPRVRIRYNAYGDESDPGPFPIPPDAPIEGAPNTDGDRHVIVIDRDRGKLYELYRAFRLAGGEIWQAESGAVFDFRTNTQRTVGWTSADAAGLPIFPGLVRYEEVVELQEIRHALRFTVANTRRAYVPPASHFASKSNDSALPPMGMRVRLKKTVDLASYPPEARVILTALQRYGMILADNGSNWFLSGTPDPRWNDDSLRTLRKIKGTDFEVVLMRGLVE